MIRRFRLSLTPLVVAALACATASPRQDTAGAQASGPGATPASAAAAPVDPDVEMLLAPWQGPNGGTPPFGKFKVEAIKPAMEQAMAAVLAEMDRIADSPEAPTFENTLVAMEKAGRPLEHVYPVYGVHTSNLNDKQMQAIEAELAPKLAAFADKITQNPKLFARIAAVYEKRDSLGLNPEQQRLLWLTYTNFVRQGARLDEAAKKRLSELNQQLASLTTRFGQNLLAEEGSQMVVLESEADLAGLMPNLKEAAAAAAASRGQPGKWAILNTRSAVEPFLTFSTRRDLREKVWRMFVMRGDNGGEHDNNGLISQILKLRAERARLLGYPTHAHWKVEDQMAKTPERAMALMEAVWKPAVARVRAEVADMQALADKEKAGIRIAPWDYRFYAEKVRKAKYDLDEAELKPYLQLDKLREAMFWVAGEVFGLTFEPLAEGAVPVFHPDVRVWEVKDKAGKHVGYWFLDPYARPDKNSGAWMTTYRSQSRVHGEVTPIASNNANFIKGAPGEPILITWDNAETMFHEFGHALHGLTSNVTYPALGMASAADFVEFPSQILERWLSTRAVLDRFARHVKTGEPMPEAMVKKIEKARTFNQGFATVEYLAAALVDMKLHLAGDTPIDPRAFEKETLKELGMPEEIVMRHRTPHFAHVFAGESYAAGYYSYLWADTLSADAWEAFVEAGSPFDKAVCAKLHTIFSVGNTIDPAEAYRAFRGRDPDIAALMRKRGFAPAAPAPGPAVPVPAKAKAKAKGRK